MAVNTTNSAALAMMNQYKLNMEANQEVSRDLSQVPNEIGENEDYQVQISEEAQQLALQAKVRNGYDRTPPANQAAEPALNRSRIELNTRNTAEATQLAVHNMAAGRYGLEVVA